MKPPSPLMLTTRRVRACDLDAERGGVSPAERALIAGRDECAGAVDRIAEAGCVSELRDLVDEDAVFRQCRPDRLQKFQLRLEHGTLAGRSNAFSRARLHLTRAGCAGRQPAAHALQ